MAATVFARTGWIPKAVREQGELRLELGAGADANHDPRTFSFPISQAHLEVIQEDLTRHLLLWCAVLPLCDAAGTGGPLDEGAAVALLNPILFGTAAEVDALFSESDVNTTMLIGHGADIALLERGQVVEALHSATGGFDGERVQTYVANRDRARRGVHLGPLDEAVLKYIGHYLHRSTVPGRHPDAVDPELLPGVLRVIATAEQACAGMQIRRDPRRGKRTTDKRDWDRMTTAVDAAVHRAHPELVVDTVRSVSFLMCSEATSRSRDLQVDGEVDLAGGGDGGDVGARKSALTFTDDNGAETTWRLGDGRTASAEFWEFVADHSSGSNEVFTIEDEALGEGIQLHFYADSVARVTTVTEGKAGAEPEYRVEYGLVDGMDGYRAVVGDFVRGGCAALERYGPWMLDVHEFERARPHRDAGKRR